MTEQTYVYVYCRVSSHKQAVSGNGLESQEKRCLAYIKNKGFVLKKVYRDEGVSGTKEKRPAKDQMFADIAQFRKKDKTSNVMVLIDDVSRFARDTQLLLQFSSTLKYSLDVKLQFVAQNHEDSPEGEFFLTINGAMATWEQRNIRRNVIKKMHDRHELGFYIYGRAKMGYFYQPYGLNGGQIQTPHAENAKVIANALKLFACGSLTSIKHVKEYLDGHKITYEEGRYRGSIRTNSLGAVRNMLNNAFFYAGFIRDPLNKASLTKGKHQAILDIDTYEAIKAKLEGRNSTYKKASEEEYPLKGWIHCPECQKPLTSNGQGSRGRNLKRYHYYYCRNGACVRYKKSNATGVVHENFERFLFRHRCPESLIAECQTTAIKLWKKRVAQLKASQAELRNRHRIIELEIGKYTKKLVETDDPIITENITKLINEKAAEKAKIEIRLTQKFEDQDEIEYLVWRVNELLSAPEVFWSKASIMDKRTMLKLLFPEKWVYTRYGEFRKLSDPLESGALSGFRDEIDGLVVRGRQTSNRLRRLRDGIEWLSAVFEPSR